MLSTGSKEKKKWSRVRVRKRAVIRVEYMGKVKFEEDLKEVKELAKSQVHL